MKIKSILLVSGLFLISTTAFAQQNNENTTKDKRTQKERIKQGIKSGEITKAEKAKIESERQDTKNAVKDAKADGTITDAERANIKKERKETSKTIYRKKHNDKKAD